MLSLPAPPWFLTSCPATLLLNFAAPLSSVAGFPPSSLGVQRVPFRLGDLPSPCACLLPGATLPPLSSSLPLPDFGAVSTIYRLLPCTFPCRSAGRLAVLVGISSGSELRGLGIVPKTFPNLCPPLWLLAPPPSNPPHPLLHRCLLPRSPLPYEIFVTPFYPLSLASLPTPLSKQLLCAGFTLPISFPCCSKACVCSVLMSLSFSSLLLRNSDVSLQFRLARRRGCYPLRPRLCRRLKQNSLCH